MDGETCLRRAYDAVFQGDFESAMYWFGQAIAIDPENAAYHYIGSITCARSGKLALALTYALKSVELDPNDSSYQLNLRIIKGKQKILEARHLLSLPAPDIENSLELLKEAVLFDPLSVEAKILLGIVYRLKQEFKLSIGSLRDALLLEPGQEEAQRLLHEVRAERRRLIKQQYSHNNPRRNR